MVPHRTPKSFGESSSQNDVDLQGSKGAKLRLWRMMWWMMGGEDLSRISKFRFWVFVTLPRRSYDKQHELSCLSGTRTDVLQEITKWADVEDRRRIFWLKGLAGTGKSTIACTIARTYHERGRLGASFFFSSGGDTVHAGKFCTSIAVQLAGKSPSLKTYICEAVVKHSDIAQQSLRDQWHHLVLWPLSKLDGSSIQSSLVLVIDALDECEGDNNIRLILQLLAEINCLLTRNFDRGTTHFNNPVSRS